MVPLKTEAQLRVRKKLYRMPPGLSAAPLRTMPQLVEQTQTLVSGIRGSPNTGCRHLVLTPKALRVHGQLWPRGQGRVASFPPKGPTWACCCPLAEFSDRLQLCI